MQRHGASPYVVQPQASEVTSGAPSRPPASSKASAESVEHPQKRKRRVITAEEREDHSYREKQRRHTLNDKFLTLARSLPTIADRKRLSKSIIIDGANQHLQLERELLLDALPKLEALIAERDDLLASLNVARQTTAPPRVSADTFQRLFAVRDYVFGTFPFGFHPGSGDDGETISMDRDSIDSREDTSRSAETGFADLSAATSLTGSIDDDVQLPTYVPPLLYLERTVSQPIPNIEGPIIPTPSYPPSSNMQIAVPQPPRPLDLARRINFLPPGQHPSWSPQAFHDLPLPPLVHSAPTSPYVPASFIPQTSGMPATFTPMQYYAIPPALPQVLPPELHGGPFPPQWMLESRPSLPDSSMLPYTAVQTSQRQVSAKQMTHDMTSSRGLQGLRHPPHIGP